MSIRMMKILLAILAMGMCLIGYSNMFVEGTPLQQQLPASGAETTKNPMVKTRHVQLWEDDLEQDVLALHSGL